MIDEKKLQSAIMDVGVKKSGWIETKDIPFHAEFRAACESNTCGKYSRCWTCPPNVGPIDELMQKARSFRRALVYQTVYPLEDSFDIEGMLEAGKQHNFIGLRIKKAITPLVNEERILQLSAGGCHLCESCTRPEEKPCLYPDDALASLEAYGIAVSELAKLCDLPYINGQNTVTYFGAVFID